MMRWVLLAAFVGLAIAGCLTNATPSGEAPESKFEGAPPSEPSPSPPPIPQSGDAEPWAPAAGVGITARHGDATLHISPDENSRSVLVFPAALPEKMPQRHDLASGESTIYIPFLDASTEYVYQILAGASVLESGGFTTASSPFTYGVEDSALIRPGANMLLSCAISAILRDASNETLFALTAGHCVEESMGADMFLWEDRTLIGEVVAMKQTDSPSQDWGLIRIANESRHLVTPSITHWTGPVGLAHPDAVPPGSKVCMYGWGNIVQETEYTRPRCGTYHGEDPTFDGLLLHFPGFTGDSGGPVVVAESGKLLGYIVRGLDGTTYEWAEPLCQILDYIWNEGYELQLLTADFAPPSSMPTLPQEIAGVHYGDVPPPCEGAYLQFQPH